VCDPTIRQPGFDLPRQQWSLLNRFHTEHGHCGACRSKWRLTDTDLCPCGETQMMSHIVESCPLTKLNGGLSQLHSADEDAVSWLTSYGSGNAYEKKIQSLADFNDTQYNDWHRQCNEPTTFLHQSWFILIRGKLDSNAGSLSVEVRCRDGGLCSLRTV